MHTHISPQISSHKYTHAHTHTLYTKITCLHFFSVLKPSYCLVLATVNYLVLRDGLIQGFLRYPLKGQKAPKSLYLLRNRIDKATLWLKSGD